jgi:hypothetical protein
METIPWLPAATNALLADAVSTIEKSLGMELASAALIGSAMNPTRGDRARAPEILVIVSHAERIRLVELATAFAPFMRRGARVRVVSEGEIARSLDVFALEIADWKARHRVLAGKDVLGALEIQPAHLRFGIEMELRGIVRRIRNRILAGLAAGRDDPTDAILAGYDRIVIAAYHAIRLSGGEPPNGEPEVLEAAGALAKAEVGDFAATLATIRRGEARIDPVKAFEALLVFTEKFTDWVDRLEVSSTLQKAEGS